MQLSGSLAAWLLCLRFHGTVAFMSPLHPSIYGKILGKPASPDTFEAAMMNAKDVLSKTKHNFMSDDFVVDPPLEGMHADIHGFGQSITTLALDTIPNVFAPNMDLIKKSILSAIATDFPDDVTEFAADVSDVADELVDFGLTIVDTLNLEEYGGWYVAAVSIAAISLGLKRAFESMSNEGNRKDAEAAMAAAADAAAAAAVAEALEEAKLAQEMSVGGLPLLQIAQFMLINDGSSLHFSLSHNRKGCN